MRPEAEGGFITMLSAHSVFRDAMSMLKTEVKTERMAMTEGGQIGPIALAIVIVNWMSWTAEIAGEMN